MTLTSEPLVEAEGSASARAVLAIHRHALHRRPCVVGTGVGMRTDRETGRSEPAIEVFVEKRIDRKDLKDGSIPHVLTFGDRRTRTTVIEVGRLRAANAAARVVRPGMSIGAATMRNAGTAGGFATHQEKTVLISCAHVLVATRDLIHGRQEGRRFDVVHPGVGDGGRPGVDTIGTVSLFPKARLSRWRKRPTHGFVDAAAVALATVHDPSDPRIGRHICRRRMPSEGLLVAKVGRSGFSANGVVRNIEFSGDVLYENGFQEFWVRLGQGHAFTIESTDGRPFATRGDSGALVVEHDASDPSGGNCAVGMIVAVNDGGYRLGPGEFVVGISLDSVFSHLELDDLPS